MPLHSSDARRALGVLSLLPLAFASLSGCTAVHEPTPVELSEGELFTNGGFESATLASWTLNTNLNATGLSVVPPAGVPDLQLSAGGKPFTAVRTNVAPESQLPAGLVAGPNVPMWPRLGLSSAVINEYNATPPHVRHVCAGQNTGHDR